jgi:hypothetical protein
MVDTAGDDHTVDRHYVTDGLLNLDLPVTLAKADVHAWASYPVFDLADPEDRRATKGTKVNLDDVITHNKRTFVSIGDGSRYVTMVRSAGAPQILQRNGSSSLRCNGVAVYYTVFAILVMAVYLGCLAHMAGLAATVYVAWSVGAIGWAVRRWYRWWIRAVHVTIPLFCGYGVEFDVTL